MVETTASYSSTPRYGRNHHGSVPEVSSGHHMLLLMLLLR